MAVKPVNVETPKPGFYNFSPLLLGFAPVLVVMGLHTLAYHKDPSWLGYLTVGAGIFMLSLAAAAIFAKQVQLEKRLEELERLKS